jgi:hypothetical protein
MVEQQRTCRSEKIMRTTDVTLNLNMGFLDGETERRMTRKEMESKLVELRCHMCNILPEPDVLGLEENIQRIAFKSLEFGEWTACDVGAWVSLTPHPPVNYGMQLVVSIQHEIPLSFTTVGKVIDAIHDNGASCPMTFEEDENYFLYPFNSEVSDMDDGICLGH